MSKTRVRIRFSKCGDLRWLSHRDLARLWERLLRRAELQLAFSEGFHPKPKISFPSALALGIEALDEVVELEIVGDFDLLQVEARISREMPVGMSLVSIESITAGLGKAKMLGASYRIELTPDQLADLTTRIDDLTASPTIAVQRDEKSIRCRTDDPFFNLIIEGNYLLFSLPNEANGSIRPSELLRYCGLGDVIENGATLQRTAVHLQKQAVQPSEPNLK